MLPNKIQHMRLAASYYCNLRCQHCYVPDIDRTKYRKMEKEQLTLEQIDAFIDLLIKDFELEKISITGGEAMYHKVWPRTCHILQYAIQRDINVQINTSGSGDIDISAIVDTVNGSLDKILLHASLDGINEKKVDKFRGRKNAFKRALKTIQDAVSAGICTQVRFTVTKDNYDDTLACYDFVTDLGADAFMVKPMYPAGSGRLNSDLLIDREKVEKLQWQLIQKSIHRKTRLDLPQAVYIKPKDFPAGANVKIFNCICGVQAGYMAYNGDIYPCPYLVGAPNSTDFVIGNIKDPNFDFREAWLRSHTYSEFRTAREDTCTTQNILLRAVECVSAG